MNDKRVFGLSFCGSLCPLLWIIRCHACVVHILTETFSSLSPLIEVWHNLVIISGWFPTKAVQKVLTGCISTSNQCKSSQWVWQKVVKVQLSVFTMLGIKTTDLQSYKKANDAFQRSQWPYFIALISKKYVKTN